MAIIDHPISLMSEQHHAFADRVASHVAIVINGARYKAKSPTGQEHEAESVGSGSACAWKGKKLILTAKHVLEGASPSHLRFFLRQGGKIDWAVKPSEPSAAEATYLRVSDIVRSRHDDLACIVLSNQLESRLDFVPLPRGFARVPRAGGGVLLYGCPSDQNVPIIAARRKSTMYVGFAGRPRGCWAVVKGNPPALFPSSFDPSRHFLLHYDPQQEGAMPHGFSGAGIWYRRAAKGPIWDANPVLAGIQIQWHRPSNLMIAIRSGIVRQFLTEAIG